MQEISNDIATGAPHDVWSELLRQSRLALAMLDAETLERLADRADELFALAASEGAGSLDVRVARLSKTGDAAHEQSLLGELLVESNCNLRVLRRSRITGPDMQDGDKWAR